VNKTLLFAALAATSIALAGCNSQSAQLPFCATSTADPVFSYTACKIEMKDFKYYPEDAYVQTGTAVTWFNFDEADHSVFTMMGVERMDSGPLKKGAAWSYDFANNTGEITYTSKHPPSLALGAMRAKISVFQRP